MTFEPEPGMRIHLARDDVVEFLPLEESGPASVFVYAEAGKEGTVYKVLKNQEKYALKVFYPEYRDIRLLENTEKLSRFKNIEGFRVAERNLIEPDEYPQLLRQYPDLTYAVLMPWIEGTVWGNLMLEPEPTLQSENYLQIAKTLTRVVNNLERQGLAHCDLSNNNFIIVNGYSEIQLIDVEDMYAPDMPRPIPDISYGTTGYRTRWIAEHGLWGPESDRFAAAILCSEILVWHNQEIREKRSGNTSFFDEEEIGEECERFKLMTGFLDNTSKALPGLFEKAWFANDFSQCPPVTEWFEIIQKIGSETAPEQEKSPPEVLSETIIFRDEESSTGEEEAQFVPEMEKPIAENVQFQLDEAILREAEAQEIPVPEIPMAEETDPSFVNPQASESAVDETEYELQSVPEAEPALVEEVDQAKIETFAQKKEDTIPRGVPPKMDVSIEILDFGVVGKPENTRHFTITNSGGAPLVVTIQADDWINISHPRLTLAPEETQTVTATLNAKYPLPQRGREYRTAIALAIESNAGGEVIGARFVIPKPAFHQSKWKRSFLGVAIGMVFSCLTAVLILSSGSGLIPAGFIVSAILFLFGLAGFIAYPRKASILFSIGGLVAIEILAILAISTSYDLQEAASVILGLGSGLGVLGGASLSRIYFGRIRPTKDNLSR